MSQSRNAPRTRQKIMDAALEEFAAKGFAGARVEAIALRAGVRKQLLYHYFPSKEALLEDALQRAIRDKLEQVIETGDLGADLRARFAIAGREPVLLRLLMWEALEYPTSRRVVAEHERREVVRHQTGAIVAAQRRGELAVEFRPELLQLAFAALASYPLIFRQVTELVTGRSSDDPAFRADWAAFLQALGSRLSD